MKIEFKNDENGYFKWLAANPHGFVLNVRAIPDSKYVVLHRASCGQISSTKRSPGAYTCNAFRKWGGKSIEELRAAAKREGRQDGTFSKRCKLCQP